MKHADLGEIDWLGFLLVLDHDHWQEDYLPFINRAKAYARQCDLPEHSVVVTPLGDRGDGKRRYVVDFIGKVGALVWDLVPLSWYKRLSRIDYRIETETLNSDDIAILNAYYQLQKKGKINVNSFNTKPRTKSASRDIGGKGIMLGSRKSDKCSALYKRGSEVVAYEFRSSNKWLRGTISGLWANTDFASHIDLFKALTSVLLHERTNHLMQAAGVEYPAQFKDMANAIRDKVPAIGEFDRQMNMLQEQAWWEAQDLESQTDQQTAKWVPTDKGWRA